MKGLWSVFYYPGEIVKKAIETVKVLLVSTTNAIKHIINYQNVITKTSTF